MRSMVVEDARFARLLAFVLREDFEHANHVRPGAATGELAIAERAGAAFAEEVVALRLEFAALVKGLHVADALRDRRAAFEQ